MKQLNLKDNSDKEWIKLKKIIKKLWSLIKKCMKFLSPSQMMNTINGFKQFHQEEEDIFQIELQQLRKAHREKICNFIKINFQQKK